MVSVGHFQESAAVCSPHASESAEESGYKAHLLCRLFLGPGEGSLRPCVVGLAMGFSYADLLNAPDVSQTLLDDFSSWLNGFRMIQCSASDTYIDHQPVESS